MNWNTWQDLLVLPYMDFVTEDLFQVFALKYPETKRDGPTVLWV